MVAQQVSFKQDTVVGKWRIGSLLGRGGQGAVWVARPTATKNSPPRALKASFATDAKGRARFEREAKMLQECTSPLILAIHDVDLSWTAHCDGIPEFSYYVTDRCEGSLEAMKEDFGDAGVRITLFVQACKSVEYLHGLVASVIHRDIKPANFLIASEPRRVVLADLGIARYEAVESELTATHEVVGSRNYRPPEAMNGDDGSVRGDVYSLGRVLEWLLTGEVSVNFSTRPIARGDYISDELCDVLERIVAKATQMAPRDRFGSVTEMLAQIPERWVTIRPRDVVAGIHLPLDADAVLTAALDFSRKADTISMRTLEQNLRRDFVERMLRWRSKYENEVFNDQQMFPIIDDLFNDISSRIVFSLGSLYSQIASFVDQRRLVGDLLSIPGWNEGGRTVLAKAPRGLVYLFHYLHGALSFELGRSDLALSLACLSLPQSDRHDPQPIWQQLDLVGWPKLFSDRPDVAWTYLRGMRTRFPILERFFTLQSDFDVGLAAYSMLLTIIEFAAKSSQLALLAPGKFQNDSGYIIPPMFIEMPTEIITAAATRTFGSRAIVDAVLQAVGAKRHDLLSIWPHLKELLNRSQDRGNRPFRRALPLGDLG